MVFPHRTVVNPVLYDVEYIRPVHSEVVHTYTTSSLGSGNSFGCSRCGPCCCLFSLLACLLLAAGLAVGIYFIVKTANNGDIKPNILISYLTPRPPSTTRTTPTTRSTTTSITTNTQTTNSSPNPTTTTT